ncbi:MAG: tetratricopeptide repeat protein [Parasulfuritortus sp.]|jgi:predicted negative regulator of RcsB-dependent stress response|nr:tetratricopeptide repeat protein [Parasulfuritortus sp.]
MALDLQEQEQLDELKDWWRKNGTYVVGVAAAIAIVVGGWRGYQVWTARQSGEALGLFEHAMQAAVGNDSKAVKELTGKIMDDYGRTGYALPAAWLAAKTNFGNGDLKSAQAQYQYALDHAKDKGLVELAKLRLAEVDMDIKDYDGAMKLLDGDHDEAFVPLFANLKGDALVAQGKTDDARAAYKLALDKLDPKSPLKAVVEIKLGGVGG